MNRNSNHAARRAVFLGAIFAGVTLLSFVPASRMLAAAPQTRARKHVSATTHASTSSNPAPVPFHIGEKLDYNVAWSSFSTAASVELSIPEQRDLYGWHTWHFRATAHTISPVRTLFPIDDEFDSYTDATTFESRVYQNYLNELGRKVDRVWNLITEGQTPRAPGPAVVVMAGTRDPLGALYDLRSIDWQHQTNAGATVFDGHQFYDMRASREALADAVEVPAGQFSATRIGIAVFQQNKQVSGVHFTIWLADNSSRTPIQMQAQMPFGTLQIQMIASSTP
jgi:Protein of unknown function (DUF3108)